MPVGLESQVGRDVRLAQGSRRTDLGGRAIVPARMATPSGFHPLALWIAAASPVAATLLLLARLAA